jgi:Uma2 family endonuclease
MDSATKIEKIYTVQEYIDFEETSPVRHEFQNGKLYAMVGTSDTHNDILNNLVGAIRPKFKDKGCKVYSESLKVEINDNDEYVYPDVLLTCNNDDRKSPYIKRYPTLIIEILSKSTAEYDRTEKFEKYQKVASIKYYLLIESRWMKAELYTRLPNDGIWTYQTFKKPTDIIAFPDLEFTLSLETIYEDINFSLRLADKEEDL